MALGLGFLPMRAADETTDDRGGEPERFALRSSNILFARTMKGYVDQPLSSKAFAAAGQWEGSSVRLWFRYVIALSFCSVSR